MSEPCTTLIGAMEDLLRAVRSDAEVLLLLSPVELEGRTATLESLIRQWGAALALHPSLTSEDSRRLQALSFALRDALKHYRLVLRAAAHRKLVLLQASSFASNDRFQAAGR